MTTITKQQVTELIDKLADKSLTFGCKVAFQLHGERQIGSVAYFVRDCENPWVGIFYYKTLESKEHVKDIEILGHAILLGDVLEKMGTAGSLYDESEDKGTVKFNSEILIELWRPCGFTKSLQEIAGRVDYEEKFEHIKAVDSGAVEETVIVQFAKPSPATDLFQFLISTL